MKCSKCGTELTERMMGGAGVVRYEFDAATGRERMHSDVGCLRAQLTAERARSAALQAEVERMREGLEWYATSEHYMHQFERVPGAKGNDPSSVLSRMYSADSKVEAGWRPVVLDAGQRARAALSQSPTEKKT